MEEEELEWARVVAVAGSHRIIIYEQKKGRVSVGVERGMMRAWTHINCLAWRVMRDG